MRQPLSHLLTKIYDKPVGLALLAVLMGLIALQVPAPPRLAAVDAEETYREFEEESTEPGETDGEQALAEFVSPLVNRVRRPDSALTHFVAKTRFHGPANLLRRTISAELANRNGVGAVLRC